MRREPPKISPEQARSLALVSKHESMAEARLSLLTEKTPGAAAGGPGLRPDWEMPRWLERAFTWICIGIVALFACALSIAPIMALIHGETVEFSKYGNGKLVFLSKQPVSFLSNLVIHLFVAGIGWGVLVVCWNRTDRQR
jgi:hypothetical protein